MTDQDGAAKVMGMLMQQCKPHLAKLHKVFKGHANISLVATLPGMPGAFLISAAGKNITPQELIKALQEVVDDKNMDMISGYGGRLDDGCS